MTDTPRDPAETDAATDAALDAEETEFSNEHPLASPNELAGDAASGIEMEFLARDMAEAQADAAGAASGIALEEDAMIPEVEDEVDTLPLDGE